MSNKPYDDTLKDLIEDDRLGWARHFNPRPVETATFVDADVSTVTAAADKVLRVKDDLGRRLLLFEPLTYHDDDAPRRAHFYATVLHSRHKLSVRAILLLLRPEANATALTGTFTLVEPGEPGPYLSFNYQVVKVWEQPLAPYLSGGLGLLPLAALTDEAAADLKAVVNRVNARLRAEAPAPVRDKLMASAYVLMGLRYKGTLIEQLFTGVTEMEESSTYQLIKSKGQVEGEKRLLLIQGQHKFGPPDESVRQALNDLTDIARLERMGTALFSAASWQELLATS